MSATVAAALKKIAVAILTDKKLRKTFLGIVLGIIVIIVMPFAAIIALFNGGINIDTNRLQTLVVQNMSAEEQARLQRVEDLMYEIEDKMTEAGFDKQRVKEAQVLYVLALSDFSEEAGFVDKLVGCFSDGQTDAQLIATVNAAFGTDLSAEDFTKVMSAIRAVYISTAGYIDPSTKNNLDLVQWAKNAYSRGWGYVWGTYGQVLTRSLYKAKAEQYPDEVGGYADFIEELWIGGRTGGSIPRLARSSTVQTACRISVPTPCMQTPKKAEPLIRSRKSQGLQFGTKAISVSISVTDRSSTPAEQRLA